MTLQVHLTQCAFRKRLFSSENFKTFLDTRVPLTIALLKRGPAWFARNRSRPVDFPWNVDTTRVPVFVRSSLISGCWTGARILPGHNDNPLRIFMWRSSLKRTQWARSTIPSFNGLSPTSRGTRPELDEFRNSWTCRGVLRVSRSSTFRQTSVLWLRPKQ